MPFGLTNAPATFQRVMDQVLGPINRRFGLVYIDDINVFSESFSQHIDHLRQVLTKVQHAGLRLNLEKCDFGRKRVRFLGHVISEGKVEMDPDNTGKVTRYPIPANKTQLWGFLSLTGYYRRFITVSIDRNAMDQVITDLRSNDHVTRLTAYYELGKGISQMPENFRQYRSELGPFRMKAARRTCEFFSECECERIGIEQRNNRDCLSKMLALAPSTWRSPLRSRERLPSRKIGNNIKSYFSFASWKKVLHRHYKEIDFATTSTEQFNNAFVKFMIQAFRKMINTKLLKDC